jgi:thymidine kinase
MLESKIEVYCGPMKSGKSLALAEAGHNLMSGGLRVAGLQSAVNSRNQHIESRDGLHFPAAKIETLAEIEGDTRYDAFIIDEFHFFEDPSTEVVIAKRLALSMGKLIIIGTLDYSYKGEEWEAFSLLSSVEGTRIVHLTAHCDEDDCGTPAKYTALYNNGHQVYAGDSVVVDGPEVIYSPRCSDHFDALCVEQS